MRNIHILREIGESVERIQSRLRPGKRGERDQQNQADTKPGWWGSLSDRDQEQVLRSIHDGSK
ncbi:MAG TPA: hypothetical protein VLB73_03165 [Patescibacteria group bacterium]|nr:hypothetical protein [Patescibacteria group bacterium]